MVNAYRGETELQLGGRTYTLRFTTNAWARLESDLDAYGFSLLQKLLQGGATSMRAVFHTCLTTPTERDQPAQCPGLTPEDMGYLLDAAGGIGAVEVKLTYWLLMVNAELLDRETAEKNGLIPKSKGPKESDVPETNVPQMRLASGNAGS